MTASKPCPACKGLGYNVVHLYAASSFNPLLDALSRLTRTVSTAETVCVPCRGTGLLDLPTASTKGVDEAK